MSVSRGGCARAGRLVEHSEGDAVAQEEFGDAPDLGGAVGLGDQVLELLDRVDAGVDGEGEGAVLCAGELEALVAVDAVLDLVAADEVDERGEGEVVF